MRAVFWVITPQTSIDFLWKEGQWCWCLGKGGGRGGQGGGFTFSGMNQQLMREDGLMLAGARSPGWNEGNDQNERSEVKQWKFSRCAGGGGGVWSLATAVSFLRMWLSPHLGLIFVPTQRSTSWPAAHRWVRSGAAINIIWINLYLTGNSRGGGNSWHAWTKRCTGEWMWTFDLRGDRTVFRTLHLLWYVDLGWRWDKRWQRNFWSQSKSS